MCIRDRSDTGHFCVTLVFEPAELTGEKTADKKTILLLEDRDEMVWLITGLLSEEYSICPVKSVQTAFDEIRRSVPALFLVDMSMYTDVESAVLEYVGKNRSCLLYTSRQSSVFHHPVEKFQLEQVQCPLFKQTDGFLCQIVVVCRVLSPMRGGEPQAEIARFAERSVGGATGKQLLESELQITARRKM